MPSYRCVLADPSVRGTTRIFSILASELSVYCASIENGRFDFTSLVVESGIVCSRCGTARCARYHGRWIRKLVCDLSTGALFRDLPILRALFCSGATRSLFPAELWRGRATIPSVVATTLRAVRGGLDHSLQWAMEAGDGDETVSERTVRRWVRRTMGRVSVATATLGFPSDPAHDGAARLENFLDRLLPRQLLQLRVRWGYSFLDRPGARKAPHSTTWPKPTSQNPTPPHDPPSEYVPRGTRCRFPRRGRPPDK